MVESVLLVKETLKLLADLYVMLKLYWVTLMSTGLPKLKEMVLLLKAVTVTDPGLEGTVRQINGQ